MYKVVAKWKGLILLCLKENSKNNTIKQRLESIDNAKPSEAMKSLEKGKSE